MNRMGSKRRSGQTLIEMAIAIPVLLVLLLGIIQFGIINNATVNLTHLSREGARFAAVNANNAGLDPNAPGNQTNDPDTKIRNRIKVAAASTPIDFADLTITVAPPIGSSERVSGRPITVNLTYPLHKKFFVPPSFPGLSQISTYKTSCSMVIE